MKNLGGNIGNQVHLTEKTVTVNYSSRVCTYNKQSKRIISEAETLQQTNIITFNISNNWLYIVDVKGRVISYNYNPESVEFNSKEVQYDYQIEGIQSISSATFDFNNEKLFYANQNNDLYLLDTVNNKTIQLFNNQNQEKNKEENVKSIVKLSKSEDYVIFTFGKHIQVFNLDENNNQYKLVRSIEHKQNVTSFTISRDDDILIVGDDMGKITHYKQFLNANPTISVQHWHSTPVSSLLINDNGSVLYSGGEEGVLVVWQQYEDKKDFFPRLGSEILGLSLDDKQTTITIVLKENTVKSLKLHNFAEDLCLQNISNPMAASTVQTQSIQQSGNKVFQSGFQQNSEQNLIICNSLPGRLQIVDLFSQIKKKEIDVVFRNLTSSSNRQTPNPTDVNAFKFDESFKILCASTFNVKTSKFSNTLSSLRFLEEKDQNSNYQIITRVDAPHGEHIFGIENFFSIKQQNNIFITYGSDNKIKLWKKFKRQIAQRRQKQEGEDSIQYFWNYYRQESFKDMKILKVIGQSEGENKEDFLYILGERGIGKLDLQTNNIIKEFGFGDNQIPLKFEIMENGKIVVAFKSGIKVYDFDSQNTEEILDLPLQNVVDLCKSSDQNTISILLNVENQSVIVQLKQNDLSKMQFSIYQPVFESIVYANRADGKEYLVGVGSDCIFKVLSDDYSENQMEVEQEENDQENQENDINNYIYDKSMENKNGQKSFQNVFVGYLSNNLREEGLKLANFFPTNSHAIPPIGLLFNQFADNFLVSNSKEQEKYKQLLKNKDEQQNNQDGGKKQKGLGIEIEGDDELSEDEEFLQENNKKQLENFNLADKQNAIAQREANIDEFQFRDIEKQINGIFQ